MHKIPADDPRNPRVTRIGPTRARPYVRHRLALFALLSRVLFQPAHSARRLHAAAAHYSAGAKSTSHTTNSYSTRPLPRSDPKVHRVDPSSEMVQKPNEPPSGPFSATGVETGVKNAQGKRAQDTRAASGHH
ncbi:hypothetical protein C8R45DRAFT_1072623 [Mycena sanguinolenta]|nr:hypothetical protein C8R45DRAFT_1072623 [Mycena sanguinolenta]